MIQIWVLSLEKYWFKLGVLKSLYINPDRTNIAPAIKRLGMVKRCITQ